MTKCIWSCPRNGCESNLFPFSAEIIYIFWQPSHHISKKVIGYKNDCKACFLSTSIYTEHKSSVFVFILYSMIVRVSSSFYIIRSSFRKFDHILLSLRSCYSSRTWPIYLLYPTWLENEQFYYTLLNII